MMLFFNNSNNITFNIDPFNQLEIMNKILKNIKNIFSDEKIKNDVNTLRYINNQIENLRENYLGTSSKAYQQARKEYFNLQKRF